MRKLTVAVLMGGTSAEREISLRSGNEIVSALKKLGKYEVKIYDPKTDLVKLVKNADKIDVALPVLHGPAGEDGTIQGFLETLKLPFGFSGVLSSALGINKLLSRIVFEKANLPVPKYQAVVSSQKAAVSIDFPLVIKPNTQGSSVGISICESKNELEEGLKEAFKYDKTVLIEEYLKGREITVGVLGQGEGAIALPVTEIVPKKEFFNFQAKYDGTTEEIAPARISKKLTQTAQKYALAAHRILGCSGVTRTDMILGSSRKSVSSKQIYVLEINTIPGFTRESLIPKAAKAAGIEFEELVERLVELVFEGRDNAKK